MSSADDKKKRRTRSLMLVLLAWVFIGGQGLLATGSAYNYQNTTTNGKGDPALSTMPWELISQSANRMRLVATQAQPDVIGNVAVFLAVVNVLGLAALVLALLAWSRSKHTSGKLTIVVAVAIVLINTLLHLPHA